MTAVRTVLAVVLAVALLGTAHVALEGVRADLTADRVAAERDEFERAATTLAADSTAVQEGDPAARTTATVRVPGRSIPTVRPDFVAIGCPNVLLDGSDGREAGSPKVEVSDPGKTTDTNDCDPAFVYQVSGESPTVLPVPSVDLATPDGPLILASGTHRLTLRYVRTDGDPVVRVTA